MVAIVALSNLIRALAPSQDAGDETRADPMDEYVTVATYDRLLDAHIALGRLSTEGIEAQLFDSHMVLMESAIAIGGIKLRVNRRDETVAKKILDTDYSATLKDVDVGKPES